MGWKNLSCNVLIASRMSRNSERDLATLLTILLLVDSSRHGMWYTTGEVRRLYGQVRSWEGALYSCCYTSFISWLNLKSVDFEIQFLQSGRTSLQATDVRIKQRSSIARDIVADGNDGISVRSETANFSPQYWPSGEVVYELLESHS